MLRRIGFVLSLAGLCFVPMLQPTRARGCCPIARSGKPVVNADQTVIILWDAVTKTQHFIRQASFQSTADNFAFLVPTPTRPELEESGSSAFPYLQKLTEPEVQKKSGSSGGIGCGCSGGPAMKNAGSAFAARVRVVDEKQVAGFNAVVLAADSSDALVDWLNQNGFEFSPAVETWAKPYVDAGWMITALKVAKDSERTDNQVVSAAALRMSFQTDRPLFPYREPDSGEFAKELGATKRLLRIYCIAEARYAGKLTDADRWTGKVAFAGKLNAHQRTAVLEALNLPAKTGPAEWWLTEFEDDWEYRVAPGDVYFARARSQASVKRPPIIEYVKADSVPDLTACAFVVVLLAGPALRRAVRNKKKGG
jgi:hypothetical protein